MPLSASAQTNAERYQDLALPMTVALVDSEMPVSQRPNARAVLEALDAIGQGPELVVGTRGASHLRFCRRASLCGDAFARWKSFYAPVSEGTVGKAFDRVFEVEAEPTSLAAVVQAVEVMRHSAIRAVGGLGPVKIWVLGSLEKAEIGSDDIVVVRPSQTSRELVDLLCGSTSGECFSPPPPILRYRGQQGVRIFVDESGRPIRSEPVLVGERFGQVPEATELAILTPWISAMSLEWNGGEQAFVHLVGQRTERMGGFYDIAVTLDGAPQRYVFDGASLVVSMPARAPGHHVLRAEVAGGQLTEPLVEVAEHDVDWIVELGTLSPGDMPRCVPLASGFGPVGELPAFLHVDTHDDEICGSVSLAAVSPVADWPAWRGADGVRREVRLHASPSPILWVVVAALFVVATFATRRLLHLLFLRRRPTHVVVVRRDDANYRDAGGPERVVEIAAGPIAGLAPELADVDLTIDIGAVMTVSASSPFLYKLQTTGEVHRGARAVLPAGGAVAVDETQIAFVDEVTANRVLAREFRALPVFSANEREATDGHEDRRAVGPVGEAAVYAVLVTATITSAVALLSTAVTFVGTYFGFVLAAGALLGLGYGGVRVLLTRV